MANKRDDDFLPRHTPQAPSRSLHVPRRSVVSRLLIYLLAILVLGFTLSKFIAPGLSPALDAYDLYRPHYSQPQHHAAQSQPRFKGNPRVKGGADPRAGEGVQQRDTQLSYSGRIKLPQLAGTLRPMMAPLSRRNVLFAAGSLQSAAGLLPLACAMAGEGLSAVHFVLGGRSGLGMGEVLRLNGVDVGEDGACEVVMHDGRPDFAAVSSDSRLRLATVKALNHIHQFMISQAIVVDAGEEEDYFLEGVREHVKRAGTTLVELPSLKGGRFSWLTKLDSASLSAWNDVHVDILIHAPPGSGNLKRLLKSLARTDISGMPTPHITIELPPVVDQSLASFLAGYDWPKSPSRALSSPRLLSLRHRVRGNHGTHENENGEEEEALRFWESFWPAAPWRSHVLILSAHAEVTPQFFQDVKYLLLKYRYSVASRQARHRRLLGISLSSPRTRLDGSEFVPPMARAEYGMLEGEETPFLWQAPTSDSMLIFGDRWVELHGFVTRSLERDGLGLARKEVGKDRPLWVEHVLKLSRLRGYVTLYPGALMGSSIMGVHTDLSDSNSDEQPKQVVEEFDVTSRMDMLATLPGGRLPPLETLPWLSWQGEDVGEHEMERTAAQERRKFMVEVGKCSEEEAGLIWPVDEHAGDLFCAIQY